MSTNFPTSLDTFPSAATLATHNLDTDPHSTLHGNLGDSVAAVEAKVGVNGSLVVSSIDYKVSNLGTTLGGNPTASAGLTAVNGSATTFMRSDGSPAISQAITPTWTNLHTFSTSPTSPGGQVQAEAWGSSATVGAGQTVAIGNSANASTASSTAIGCSASVTTSTGGVAIGKSAQSTGQNAISIGVNTIAAGQYGVSIGGGIDSRTNYAVVIGGFCSISAGLVVAGPVIGVSSSASAVYAMAYGANLTASHACSTLIGGGIASSRARETVFGYDGNQGAPTGTGGHRIRVVSSISSTGYDVGIVDFPFYNSTAATHQGQINLSPVDYNATRVAFSVAANGTVPILSFYGGTMIAQPAQYTLVGTATRTMPTDNCAGGAATMAQVQTQVSELQGIVYQLLKDLGSVAGSNLLNTSA